MSGRRHAGKAFRETGVWLGGVGRAEPVAVYSLCRGWDDLVRPNRREQLPEISDLAHHFREDGRWMLCGRWRTYTSAIPDSIRSKQFSTMMGQEKFCPIISYITSSKELSGF